MNYEFRGKSVKEALQKSLKKLSLAEDEVEVTILDEGKRGLFSLEGKQQAVILVKPRKTQLTAADFIEIQKKIKKHLSEILRCAGIPFKKINTTMMTGRIFINIICGKNPMDEDFLFALESIIYEIINKDKTSSLKIHLDSNFIIKKMEENLREKTIKIAHIVKKTGKPHKFSEPLRFFFRKIVHDAVREVPGTTSVSHGSGEEKTVEIYPKP